MTNFKTPFDITFEDRILGGKLTLRQTLWFFLPVIYFLVKIQNPSSLISSAASLTGFILITITLFAIAMIFSFIDVNGLHLDKYIYKLIKFKLRKTVIKNYE